MRISDWSSDVCSADLFANREDRQVRLVKQGFAGAIERQQQDQLQWIKQVVGELDQWLVEPPPCSDQRAQQRGRADRQSAVLGKSVAVRVEHACGRILTNKTNQSDYYQNIQEHL